MHARLHEAGNAPGRWYVRPQPQPEIAVRAPVLLGGGSRFDKKAARPAQHQPPPVGELEILGKTVDRSVGWHRRDHDTLLEGDVLEVTSWIGIGLKSSDCIGGANGWGRRDAERNSLPPHLSSAERRRCMPDAGGARGARAALVLLPAPRGG